MIVKISQTCAKIIIICAYFNIFWSKSWDCATFYDNYGILLSYLY